MIQKCNILVRERSLLIIYEMYNFIYRLEKDELERPPSSRDVTISILYLLTLEIVTQ